MAATYNPRFLAAAGPGAMAPGPLACYVLLITICMNYSFFAGVFPAIAPANIIRSMAAILIFPVNNPDLFFIIKRIFRLVF